MTQTAKALEPSPSPGSNPDLSPNLAQAYAACRAIARLRARNFYYAFIALPPPRRNAICAVYAFMRQADDLTDDETLPREDRRIRLDRWLASWHEACESGQSSELVFTAVLDATRRFSIPLTLLDELVAGTAMDLKPATADAPDTYATFADLYRYCYFVASVVGLVCIRIFGYKDPRAEKLAEETGIAFQLTNILRDVAEDAARNRVYLPLEDFAAHNLALESLLARPPAAPPTVEERALLAATAQRAEDFYRSARKLLPLIDRESRPALWVLVNIYRELLIRIRRADYDVFTHRASVPLWRKLTILVLGLTRMAWARMLP
ncbi:MAG: phytoene/squalene synthase family protein [Terracidiphilus sp.]